MTQSALILVDVQNDFCPGGSLAVSDGDQVVEPLNRMTRYAVESGWEIYASRDWHPATTKHFEKWPVHCVQNTVGAEFHPRLLLPREYDRFEVISKGQGDADDYSAFDGGMKPEAKMLYVGGLATNFCVLWTVRRAVEEGCRVVLLSDACRAVTGQKPSGEEALAEMRLLGVRIMTVDEALDELGR